MSLWKKILLFAVIILGGGWLLTSLNFMPWFAIGLPVVVALLAQAILPAPVRQLSYDERHPNLARSTQDTP